MIVALSCVALMELALILKFYYRFPHCDCIQLGYSVHAVAKVGRMMIMIILKVTSMMMKVADQHTPKTFTLELIRHSYSLYNVN